MGIRHFKNVEARCAQPFEFVFVLFCAFLFVFLIVFMETWKVGNEDWKMINLPKIFVRNNLDTNLPISLFSGKVILITLSLITNQHTDSHPGIKPAWPRSLNEWPCSLSEWAESLSPPKGKRKSSAPDKGTRGEDGASLVVLSVPEWSGIYIYIILNFRRSLCMLLSLTRSDGLAWSRKTAPADVCNIEPAQLHRSARNK